MKPEAPLVTAARMLCGTSDRGDLDDALKSVTDWTLLVSTAERQNLLPVLHWAARESDLPGDVRNALEKDYWNSLARSAVFERELDGILAALDEEGIPAIVLKGAALAGTVYDDPALRPMSDLDLMVREEDYARACERISFDLPYRKRADMEDAYMDLTHAVFVGGATGRVTIEVHKSLLGDIRLRNEESVWARAVRDSGRRTVLCPEDMLAHLCAHSALRHQFRSLGQLLDIALVIRAHGGLDWPLFAARCEAFGAARPILTALNRVEEVLGIGVPVAVRKDLSAVRDGVMRGAAMSLAMYGGGRQALRILGRLALQKGWRGKARYVWWNLFPPADWLSRSVGVRRVLACPYRIYRVARAGAAFAGYLARRLVKAIGSGGARKPV